MLALLTSPLAPQAAPASHAKVTKEPPAGAVALSSAPEQKTVMSLPFEGVWGVVQGMDSGGSHSGYAAFALDFVPAEPVSESAFRKRKRLADHPCYGKAILPRRTVAWCGRGTANANCRRSAKRANTSRETSSFWNIRPTSSANSATLRADQSR